MKGSVRTRIFLIALSTFVICSHSKAQVFANLHNFTVPNYNATALADTNGDGSNPAANLILSGNALYGVASDGGANGGGTVFAVKTDGACFRNLHNFAGYSDGSTPAGGLILFSNTLYGTTEYGGTNGLGTVFAVNTDGTGFTNLYQFAGNNGSRPEASLILSGYTLYGTTAWGGSNGYGALFAINTDGTDFTNLYDFTGGSDGRSPEAGLILSGDTLYGTTFWGGTNNCGTVFAVHTDGTGFTNLYRFTNGNDGANPDAGLVLLGNTLYGTTEYGGTNGYGTVFAINTDGAVFTNLHEFVYGVDEAGAYPEANLVSCGNTLYGTTSGGGNSDYGVVFAIKTDGTGFTNLYNFSGDGDGASPAAGLILSGNTLYGTSEYAGNTAFPGGVFALSLGPIPMNVQNNGTNQILTWGNPAFGLQIACGPGGPWSTLTNAASPYTVSATNAQDFFRLVYTNSP
jgi:uncharacterized repeat protein (TIGR03803 family)